MESKEKDQVRLFILLIVIIVATLIVMLVAVNIGNLGIYFGSNSKSLQAGYEETSIITEIAGSNKTSTGGKILDVILEQNKLINVAGTSILTSKVTNKGIPRDSLRFKIKFIGYDGNIILEIMGYIGKIKTNEIKYIDSYITKNISKYKEIVYQLI